MAGIPRMITVRVVLFLLLLMAVLAAAYGALRWYAMHEWYVGLDHQHLAIYQGHPGGFLWFKPRLVDDTKVMTSEVLSFHLPALRADKAEPTESAARRYIADLYQEYQAFHQPPTAPAPAGSP